MNFDELFTHAVALLPGPVRERLDGDFALDWTVLEDAATGVELGEAVRARARLPQPVEVLVHRLIRDIGIVPADVAAGIERAGAASAWIHWVTMEADGESYQLRNDRSGDVHADVRPESVAGYATLGMDLATILHHAVERWVKAGDHHRATSEDERGSLARCAVRMHTHLQAQPETISGQRTAASLARTLEYAWNTQEVEVREALSGIRLSTARGARAPRRRYYAPITGHRLHACDAGEIRWLRALADRAAAGAGAAAGEAGRPAREVNAAGDGSGTAAGGVVVRSGDARKPRPGSDREDRHPPTLQLGSAPERLMPESEVAELGRAANHLSGAVRRRLGEAYGTRVAEAVGRLQDSRIAGALRSALQKAPPDQAVPVAPWLGELASALLADAGAQTRDGLRTAPMRLEEGRRPGDRHRATEVESGAFGYLTPCGLVEQIRLGLAHAHDAWAGLTALRNAGKEGEWALNEAEAGSSRLSGGERETLEAARDIGQALGRIQRAHAVARGKHAASALDQAEMAAETLKTVGPTVRTTAGWPGAAPAPNPRAPQDIARIAAVGEGLHGEIRAIANRLIAGWVAEVQDYGESRSS